MNASNAGGTHQVSCGHCGDHDERKFLASLDEFRRPVNFHELQIRPSLADAVKEKQQWPILGPILPIAIRNVGKGSGTHMKP